MAQSLQHQKEGAAIITPLSSNNHPHEFKEEKEILVGTAIPPPPPVPPRLFYVLGDITAGPAFRFAQWLESVRKRSGQYRSGFPNRPPKFEAMPLGSFPLSLQCAVEPTLDFGSSSPSEQAQETCLWERLGRAAVLDIESNEFSWDTLSSLYHTEHSSSTEHSEDEMNKPLEVTVNSGGVVFFALFNTRKCDIHSQKEAAAVIKISSTRMATQSERFGYELAKWLGVCSPQFWQRRFHVNGRDGIKENLIEVVHKDLMSSTTLI